MIKNTLLRISLGGMLLVAISGVSQASCPLLPRPACQFIHYFEAAGESRELTLVERVWLALLMTGQERREQRAELKPQLSSSLVSVSR